MYDIKHFLVMSYNPIKKALLKKKKNSMVFVKDSKADFIQDHHSVHGDHGDGILLLRKQAGLLTTGSRASGHL